MLTYCSHCMNSISEKEQVSTLPVTLFDFISFLYFHGNPLEISTNEQDVQELHGEGVLQAIEFLEEKGFIVSCDSGLELIKVKPLGFRPYTNGIFLGYHFCKHVGHPVN